VGIPVGQRSHGLATRRGTASALYLEYGSPTSARREVKSTRHCQLFKLRFRSKANREHVSEYHVLLRAHSNVTCFGYLVAYPIIGFLILFQTVAFPQCDHYDFAATVVVF